MTTQDVAKVRAAVLERLRDNHYPPGLSLKAIAGDTLLDTLEVETHSDITDNHRLIVHLVTKALEGRRCEVCRGELIGSEIGHGTCGQCGGRAIHPTTQEATR